MNNSYIKQLEVTGLKVADPSLTSNQHQRLVCLLCNNSFVATPKSKVSNFKKSGLRGCPGCTRKQQYSEVNSKNEQRLLTMGYIILEKYQGLHVPILLKNSNCKCGGTAWKTKPERIFTGRSYCAPCNVEKKKQRMKALSEEFHKNSLATKGGYERYKQLVYKRTRDSYRKHSQIINPQNLPRALAGGVGYHLDHIVSVKYCFQNDIPAEICSDYRNLTMTEWKANIKKSQKANVRFPDIFYPYIKAMYKLDNFIKTIGSTIGLTFELYKDFNPYNLTLFNRECGMGLMFITLNEYRQQTIRTKYYFRDMKKFFNSKSIRVLFIFEDEWNSNKNLVISKIKHYFHVSTLPKRYARKCIIKEVGLKEKRTFLNTNHIQRSASSKVNLGAFFNGELIALMTFSTPRIFMNKAIMKHKYKWELVRFATDNRYHVVGIGSKLLKHFELNYEWNLIYSFADRRWSEGNLYYQLGFVLDRTNKPEYYYIEQGMRKHRYNFRKDIIKHKLKERFDPALTEYQNMLNQGYDRVWDCGTLKFIKQKTGT